MHIGGRFHQHLVQTELLHDIEGHFGIRRLVAGSDHQNLVPVLLHGGDHLIRHLGDILHRAHQIIVFLHLLLNHRNSRPGGTDQHRLHPGCDSGIFQFLGEQVGGVIALRVHGSRSDDVSVGHGPQHVENPPVRSGSVAVITVHLGDQRPLRGVGKGDAPVDGGY